MKTISSLDSAMLGSVKDKKYWLCAILVSTILGYSSTVQASTVQPLTQYCPEGDIFIPADKICTVPIGTEVNGESVPIFLHATIYHEETNEVEYNLLNPILQTIPGSDGDQIQLNQVSILLDPVLEFEVSFLDFGDPSSFNLTFTSFPFAPSVLVESSLSGLLTDNSASGDGVSLTTSELVRYEFLDAEGNLVNSSANSFSLGSSVSFPIGPPDNHVYGPLSTENILTCDTPGCGTVKLSLAFTGSGGGDSYQFSSRSAVTAAQVPEPSATVAFALFGIAGTWGLKKKHSLK
ncbi:MAG: hypothetical protein F6K54_23245 [Okeania sp. SIO3B5]|uniref:hypothetical protein n=1 Tax=Okeania sp. SIO3B5 TaxID=2607811 RepID=UPI00140116CC|nr:hypothetical protein [Okeania sp. SIO3B5]NEO55725.1 hypothetical protein [Okeania sp. SIO3B5]